MTDIRKTADAVPADFADVSEWVFDLDNTLYPRRTNLFAQIDV
ncbi:MAG: pyrimidine 5'-nucleotidase, partial [Hyphomicrobiales bacterium]